MLMAEAFVYLGAKLRNDMEDDVREAWSFNDPFTDDLISRLGQ